MKRKIRKLLIILLGNLLLSTAVVYFILPCGLITGGTAGIALFFHYLCGMPITPFVWAFNIVMFLLGYWILGRFFAFTTLLSTIFYPLSLQILQKVFEYTGPVTDNLMLATLYAGALVGVGVGMVIREGASTGGVDIPTLIFQHQWGWSVSITMGVLDAAVLLSQMLFTDWEQILYGIVQIGINTIVLEELLVMGNRRIQLKILSPEYKKINEAIHSRIDRGTTLVETEGGYSREESYLVLTVVTKRELFHVKELVLEADPTAFMIVSQVSEVHGRGFSRSKHFITPESRPK